MNRGREGRARTIALALQNDPETALAGDVSRAILALYDWQPQFAWELLCRHEPTQTIPLAPGDYFRAGFAVDPQAASAILDRLRSGELDCTISPRGWFGIACVIFAIGSEDLSEWALDQAAAAADAKSALTQAIERLRRWHGRRDQRRELEAPGPIAFALLDDRSPEPAPKVGRAPNERQQRVVRRELARRPDTKVRLYDVGRNAAGYADVPRGTWLVLIGALPRPLFGLAASFPFDERYRPLFASIKVEGNARLKALTPAALGQLRDFGPVGCANRDTYYLMRAANVPAFLAEDGPEIVGTTMNRILDGAAETDVYSAWQQAAAPAVAASLARDSEVLDSLPIRMDVGAVCDAIRAGQVTIERSDSRPYGPEINLEFSLDGNLKPQMIVCLDSIVSRTSRPIRLFVLCRDHTAEDYERLATLFPTVSFVWLPTDDVDHGEIAAMIDHITVATMDRLLLPDLLPHVDRIIHHDIDAVCLTDIARLSDLDLRGHPLAAATSTRGRFKSGFNELRGTAFRLRAHGHPALADELIARTHLRHSFDFEVFNAGVMVLDLARMRNDGFCREFFPYVERYEMNDQAVLNAYAGADRRVLDSSWNWCPRLEDVANPKIVHWAGPMKPWKPAWVRAEEIWQAAEAEAATRLRITPSKADAPTN